MRLFWSKSQVIVDTYQIFNKSLPHHPPPSAFCRSDLHSGGINLPFEPYIFALITFGVLLILGIIIFVLAKIIISILVRIFIQCKFFSAVIPVLKDNLAR